MIVRCSFLLVCKGHMRASVSVLLCSPEQGTCLEALLRSEQWFKLEHFKDVFIFPLSVRTLHISKTPDEQ